MKSRFILAVFGLCCLWFASFTASRAQDSSTDSQLNGMILGALIAHPEYRPYLVNARVQYGIVILTGFAETEATREKLISLIKSVEGVRSVVDLLQPGSRPHSDEQIRDTLVRGLKEDPVARRFPMQISVTEGVVTLNGEVAEPGDRFIVLDTAKDLVPGKPIINLLRYPDIPARSDQEILTQVRRSMDEDTRLNAARVTIEVVDGEATLSGVVNEPRELMRTYYHAWVGGVQSVKAHAMSLAHRFPVPAPRKSLRTPDDEIRTVVKEAFLYDPRITLIDPYVGVSLGEVTLQGAVKEYEAKRAAGDTARNTVGVVNVVNAIMVVEDPDLSDSGITEAVKRAFTDSEQLRDTPITILTEGGTVRLTGSVSTETQKIVAGALTAKVKGVRDITNDLIVNSGELPISNEDITARITPLFQNNPYVSPDMAEVTVINGRVNLAGTVATEQQRYFMTDVALGAGALIVDNRIVVEDRKTP